MNTDISNLKEKGLVHVPYPTDLRPIVTKAMESWRKFCALPEETKTKIFYENETGYELKKTPGANLDLKENFHVRLGQKDRLQTAASQDAGLEDTGFIDSSFELLETIKPLIQNFAESVEKEFDMSGFAEQVMENNDNWTVRFLHYFGGCNDGDEIAAPHADKGGFTLHLYESDPGLQYLSFDKKWEEMPVSESETVIIPAFQLQYRSENKLTALCHRVVATEHTAKHGRFSSVLFVTFKGVPSYNKDGIGRMQDFAPGFNYTLPFEDLSKMFK